MFPLEFRGEINHEETRVTGLLGGQSCMILTSSVFDWSTRVTDRWTDRQTDGRAIAYTRYSIYGVARKKLDGLAALSYCCLWYMTLLTVSDVCCSITVCALCSGAKEETTFVSGKSDISSRFLVSCSSGEESRQFFAGIN